MIVAGETMAGEVVAGTVVAGDAGSSDPLAVNKDGFSGTVLDSAWQRYEPNLATIEESVSGGELNYTCNFGGVGFSLWYNANEGVLLYKEITGDFDVVAGVRVRNSADDGLPTVGDGHYRIAGIAAHDPDRSVDLDYVHVGLGCTASGVITCEWKDTQASTSFFADYTDADVQTGRGEIRLRRVGQVYDFFYRASPADAWILIQTRGRSGAPLPATLQVGFVAYSDDNVLENADIRLFVDYIHFTTP